MYMLSAAGFAALRELSSKWALAKSLGLTETDGDEDDDHDATVARKRRRRVARPRHKVPARVLCCLLFSHFVSCHFLGFVARCRVVVRKI